MKKPHILVFIFLISTTTFSQINLSVNLKRSHSKYDINFIVDTLKIFKEDILYKKIPYPNSFALYENVPNGKYKFCYKNLFGEKIEKIVSLSEVNNILGSQEVDLYVDQLQNPKPNKLFIDNLKNGDSLTVRLRYSGCFTAGENSFLVYKKNNSLFLKSKHKKRKLKTRDIEALVKYETELRNLPPRVDIISTSNGFNEISFNGEKFTYNEPSFFWGGYEILQQSLRIK